MSKSLIQERAQITAEQINLKSFFSSNRCLQNFLRRNNIQSSLKLHEKGGSILPMTHVEIMEDIRQEAFKFQLRHVWNMDEFGLFYRMIPNISYPSPSEDRSSVKGTENGKQKARVTIAMSCNANGSIVLPVFYIGNSKKPRFFRTGKYEVQSRRYMSQQNG